MPTTQPHLAAYPWYAPHQGWIAHEETGVRADLRDAGLRDADLSDADLRGADLREADLSDADLRWANLSGADLRWANLRRANLREADLRWANLSGANLSVANLRGADLREADLSDADLSEADLSGADLSDADLRWADLRDADLQDVEWGLAIPVIPEIDSRILDAVEAGGCLRMDMWHSCATTHCRAGWAIVVAGPAGHDLERKTSPYLAGRLIYEASRPGVPCPDFFASDADAMNDLRRAAGR